MKKKLKILIVSSEIAPFSKTNNLAEVNGSYSKNLKDIGHDVRIITPQYRVVNERKYTLRDVIRLKDIDVSVGSDVLQINVKSSFLPDSKVQVYFIDYKPYFFREGLYRDPDKNEAYSDNDKRFILFSKSVMETLKKLQWQPDVIHCNDWQTGLIPFLIEYMYKKSTFFQQVSTLLTIRDFTNQGRFNSKCFSLSGIKEVTELKDKFLTNGTFNFLKAGMSTADCVNFTSSKYVKQLETNAKYKEFFEFRKDKINHIKDQIDYTVWSPVKDPYIPENYDAEELENKEKNKKNLLEVFNLKYDNEKPVFSVISSFIDEFGVKLIKESIEALLKMDIYVIIITSKDDKYYDFFKKMEKKHKNRMGLQEYYEVSLEHMAVAGSDIILLPIKYDSTGLSPVYSLMYGTVPVVYNSGESIEHITQYDSKKKIGNGFVFGDFNKESLVACVKNVLDSYKKTEVWKNIINNAITGDYIKQDTIRKYEKLYYKCIKKIH